MDPYLAAATDALWVRSGRQFGQRILTLRPCAAQHVGDAGRWNPSWGRIAPWGAGWCRCGGGGCSCDAGASEIELGLGEFGVLAVRVDGDVISDADYEVQEGRWLVYLADTDGQRRTWPTFQRLDRPDTEEGTWSIRAVAGTPVPQLGVFACAELACELSLLGTDECRLDPRTVSEVRRGLSFEFLGLSEALANGSTGLPLVDLFCSTYNPRRLPRRSRVLWPPQPHHRRTDTVGS